MSKAELRFVAYDAGPTASFEIDAGTNVAFRIDVANAHGLFEPDQTAARTASNFWASSFVGLPAGGVARYTLPPAVWQALDRSGGRLYLRVTTRNAAGGNLLRSVPFGQSQLALSIVALPPSLTRIDPPHGPAAGGTSITLHGAHLEPTTEVTIGGAHVALQQVSATALVVTSPAVASPALAPVVVTSPLGASPVGPATMFTYDAPALPEITSPPPGTTLTAATVTFTWRANTTAVEEWWLSAESEDAPGTTVVHTIAPPETAPAAPLTTTGELVDLPLDGRLLRVTLWYRIGGAWASSTFRYAMAADPAYVAAVQRATNVLDHRLFPIAEDGIQYPASDDLLVLVYGDRAAVLPAAWHMVYQPVAGGPPLEPIAIAAFPTIGKESHYLVNVGGRIALAMDSGGRRTIVFPHALGLTLESLGAARVDGIISKHIDTDHGRNLKQLVETFGIAPRNLFFHDVFLSGGAAGNVLPDQLREVTEAFPGASFGVIHTPPPGVPGTFRFTVQRGEVQLDMVGDSEIFNRLRQLRESGTTQKMSELRDAAIGMWRIQHQRSGQVMLDITDLRGTDITRYRNLMGAEAFTRFVGEATVIAGFQHHLGKIDPLTSEPEAEARNGLIQLLSSTYLRTGRLDVVVQTRLASGSFVLNQSLVRVLVELGVNVHLVLDAVDGSVGTLTWRDDGRLVRRGGGEIRSLLGNRAVRASAARLGELAVLAELSTRYAAEVPAHLRAKLQGIEVGHLSLSRAWETALRVGMGNLLPPPQRGNPQVLNEAELRTSLEGVLRTPAQYLALSVAERADAMEGHFTLKTRDRFQQQVEQARQTGRLGYTAVRTTLRLLRQLMPDRAIEIVQRSNLERRERERVLQILTRPRTPVTIRVGSAGLLLLMAAGEVLRWLPLIRAYWYRRNVKPGLAAICWWQDMGIQPKIKALDDGVLSNTLTEDPEKIRTMVEQDELDAIVVTDLPREPVSAGGFQVDAWDIVAFKLNTLVSNYLDWSHFVEQSPAIRRGTSDWQYRLGDIVSLPLALDFDVTESWMASQRLTRLLAGLLERVRASTAEDIQALRYAPGPSAGPAYNDPSYVRHDTYEGKPMPTALARFQPGVTRLFTPDGALQYYTHYSPDSLFYVFPSSVSEEPVPSGYVVVGGASFETYREIADTLVLTSTYAMDPQGNIVNVAVDRLPNRMEYLWARETDVQIQAGPLH